MNEEEQIKELKEALLSQVEEKVKLGKWTMDLLSDIESTLDSHLG